MASVPSKTFRLCVSRNFFVKVKVLFQTNSDLRPLGDRDHRAFHADHRGLLLPTSLVQVRMPFRSNFRTPWKSLFNPNPSRHHKMRQMRSMHPRMPCSWSFKSCFCKRRSANSLYYIHRLHHVRKMYGCLRQASFFLQPSAKEISLGTICWI